MKTLKEQIENLQAVGYASDTARAKAAHDVVLLALHRSGFKSNSTIKGGVVMSSLTGDIRRATMDMDIDFIRYSLAEASVKKFVARLAKAVPEFSIKMIGKPVELRHEDYRGKRVYLTVKDDSLARAIRTKVDIGVHDRTELRQVELSFEMASGAAPAELQANSQEQIFAEKLLSLLRHGGTSNRPKDIFDMYYLSGRVRRTVLRKYIDELIYTNSHCRIDSHASLMRLVRMIFGMKTFTAKLNRTRVNWLQISPAEALDDLMNFLGKLR